MASVEGLVAYTDRDTAEAGQVRVLRASTLGDGALIGTAPFMFRDPNVPEDTYPVGEITGVELVPPAYEGGIGSVQVTGTVDLDALANAGGADVAAQLQTGGHVEVSLSVKDPTLEEVDGKMIVGGPWTVQSVMVSDPSPWPGCNIRQAT